MDIYAFTHGRPYFRPGWSDEDVITLFGSATIDLQATPPTDDAVLTALVMFGEVKVIVPPGLRVTISGVSLFSNRNIVIESVGDGPRVRLTLSSLFGSIKVVEAGAEGAGQPGQPAVASAQPGQLPQATVPGPVTGQTIQLDREETIN